MKYLLLSRARPLVGYGLVIALFLSPRSASACSMCRCGDPTFNALGTNIFTPGRFRFALDWERFDKEQGVTETGSAEVTGHDAEIENRVTATLAYSFGESVTLVGRVPFSFRHMTSTEEDGSSEVMTSNGLSDPEISAVVRLWDSGLSPGLGRRSWVSLVAGVKTPWGRNDIEEDGVRLDEHLQPGTGSTDFFGGPSLVHLINPESSFFASFQYRATGTNSFDYKYGNVTMANVAYERKLGTAFDAVIELNYRHAQQDRIDSDHNVDPNTGGDVLYLTPRVIVDLGRGVLARAAVQIPVVKSLYGDQKERVNFNAGLTFLF